jgi:hypothetical protein
MKHHRCGRFQNHQEHQHECPRRSKSPATTLPQRRHSFSFGEASSNQQRNNCHHHE